MTGDVAAALALVRAGVARCVHGAAFPCEECKRLVRMRRWRDEAEVGADCWWSLSIGQWAIPQLPGETDEQWRARAGAA